MPFVKIDCGILDSTIWFDREAREVFITALLMAEPYELREPVVQLAVRSLDPTGWQIPHGWYGLVRASGPGIVHRAMIDPEAGLAALERLGQPEETSRSKDFDGRRLVRISGGWIVLNYQRYRERDYSAAERQRRYRSRQKPSRDVTRDDVTVTPNGRDGVTVFDNVTRKVTQAEAEVEAEAESIGTNLSLGNVLKKESIPRMSPLPLPTPGRVRPGPRPVMTPPTLEEVAALVASKAGVLSAEEYLEIRERSGWTYGENRLPIINWKADWGQLNRREQVRRGLVQPHGPTEKILYRPGEHPTQVSERPSQVLELLGLGSPVSAPVVLPTTPGNHASAPQPDLFDPPPATLPAPPPPDRASEGNVVENAISAPTTVVEEAPEPQNSYPPGWHPEKTRSWEEPSAPPWVHDIGQAIFNGELDPDGEPAQRLRWWEHGVEFEE